MITRWKLRNFKSVRDQVEIDLAPLTVFAGTNSSGKSTLLQSILLVSQTLMHENISQQIVLNGRYLQMGDLRDIKTVGSDSDMISIGWELAPWKGDPDDQPANGPVSAMACTLELNADENASDIPLSSISIAIERYEINGREYRYLFHAKQISDKASESKFTLAETAHGEALSRTFNYDVQLERNLIFPDVESKNINLGEDDYRSEITRVYITDHKFENRGVANSDTRAITRGMLYRSLPLGCSWWHFLPDRITVSVDTAVERIEAIRNMALGEPPSAREAAIIIPESVKSCIRKIVSDISEEDYDAYEQLARQEAEEELSNEMWPLKNLVEEFLELLDEDELPVDEVWEMLSEGVSSNAFVFREIIMDKLNNNREFQSLLDSMIAMAKRNGEGDPKVVEIDFNEDGGLMKSFFTRSVRYIGPLRFIPDPSYPFSSALYPDDVGPKGENVAAVLDAGLEDVVKYIPPVFFQNASAKPEAVVSTLQEALADWLGYLGMATEIESKDLSRYGYSLMVSTNDSEKRHDLTAVGVGVSQVLPILVAGLRSEPDTTLIVEQPELHLHPNVQSRLADFFLSLTRLGKQCLLETHSEHLINRIRLRIAEGTAITSWQSDTRIYFVEKQNGISSYREVCVNKYGAVETWPEGFFDESLMESEKRIRAATLKRSAKRHHN